VLGFVQREGKRRGGDTWWELVAGEEADEGLSTCRRAAAAAVVGSSQGGARRVKERMRPTSVAEMWGCSAQGQRTRTGLLLGRAIFSLFFLSLFCLLLPPFSFTCH
jgi:hypothetical protein